MFNFFKSEMNVMKEYIKIQNETIHNMQDLLVSKLDAMATGNFNARKAPQDPYIDDLSSDDSNSSDSPQPKPPIIPTKGEKPRPSLSRMRTNAVKRGKQTKKMPDETVPSNYQDVSNQNKILDEFLLGPTAPERK